jgi:SUN domain-containing protein 1/2
MIASTDDNSVLSLDERLRNIEHHLSRSFFFDRIGLKDYAQWAVGGRVIYALTSETYGMDVGQSRYWTRSIFGSKAHYQEWRLPEMAISVVNEVGTCWPMKGSSGSLGVRLARTIRPEAFTIEHSPRILSIENSTAPREIEVWGLRGPFPPQC